MAENLEPRLQAIMDSDPEVQRLLQQYRTAPRQSGPGGWGSSPRGQIAHQIAERIRQVAGLASWPQDYAINLNAGKVTRNSFRERTLDPIFEYGATRVLPAITTFGAVNALRNMGGDEGADPGDPGYGPQLPDLDGESGDGGSGGGFSFGGMDLNDLLQLITGGVSAAVLAANRGTQQPALDPTQQALQNDILNLGKRRLERIEPIHEAAMRLASGLSRGTQGHPGVARAAQTTGLSGGSRPTAMPSGYGRMDRLDPQIAEAFDRLSRRAG